MVFQRRFSVAQKIGILLAAAFFVVAGSLHFIRPEFYLRIMPPYVPWHVAMVRVSGFFEILGGLGLSATNPHAACLRV